MKVFTLLGNRSCSSIHRRTPAFCQDLGMGTESGLFSFLSSGFPHTCLADRLGLVVSRNATACFPLSLSLLVLLCGALLSKHRRFIFRSASANHIGDSCTI